MFKRRPSTRLRVGATQFTIFYGKPFLLSVSNRNSARFSWRWPSKKTWICPHVRFQLEGSNCYLERCCSRFISFVGWMDTLKKQNVRIWGEQRPTIVNIPTLNCPSVTNWCAISKQRVIGPSLFENENVTGENYRNVLINFAFLRFKRNLPDYLFVQDGASPHYATRVRAYLNRKKPNYWIVWEDLCNGHPCILALPDLTSSCVVIWKLVYMLHQYCLLKIWKQGEQEKSGGFPEIC